MEQTMSIVLSPIGTFSCDETKKYDVPRQAVLNPKHGLIKLNSGQNFEQAVDDLSGFSHIWLIYLFNNTSWKPKVQTPRSLVKKGIFATRSPYRPNPIGMSLVELVDINKLEIKIKNYDLLDKTQILDIKPYINYSDNIHNYEEGWLGETEKFDISFSNNFYKQLLKHFPDKPNELLNFINQQLSYTPINHSNKRVKPSKEDSKSYILSYQYYRISFAIVQNTILITNLNKVAQ